MAVALEIFRKRFLSRWDGRLLPTHFQAVSGTR